MSVRNEPLPLTVNVDLDDRAFLFPSGKSVTRLVISTDADLIHFDAIYPFNTSRTSPRIMTLRLEDAREFALQMVDTVYNARTQHAFSETMRIDINVLANGYHLKIGDLNQSTDLYLGTSAIWRVCQGVLRAIDHISPIEAQ